MLLKPSRRDTARPNEILVDGEAVPVRIRRHQSAKRMILRLEELGPGVVVTVPARASAEGIIEFVARHRHWIAVQRRRKPEAVALRPGSVLPLRGAEHLIEHEPYSRGVVWVKPGDPPRLCVSGSIEHAQRRLLDWLTGEARLDLLAASSAHAREMGVRWTRLTVRDTASRWGSCSTTGALSYSWRLVLAPPFVLDYVAAHEVAHLREMNHGRTFWTLVEAHCNRAREARRWLKTHGRSLHRYGVCKAGSLG